MIALLIVVLVLVIVVTLVVMRRLWDATEVDIQKYKSEAEHAGQLRLKILELEEQLQAAQRDIFDMKTRLLFEGEKIKTKPKRKGKST